MPQPSTLLELIELAPSSNTAFFLPDSGVRVTYQSLKDQVKAMADALAAIGIQRGDRVATVLPNGLPAIVSFLAASIAGTAAPLNPGYREDEFNFLSGRHGAKVLLCPPMARRPRAKPPKREAFPCIRWRWMRADSSASPELRQTAKLRPRLRPTTSRSCCTPAAARGGPSACRSCIEYRRLHRQHRGPLCA